MLRRVVGLAMLAATLSACVATRPPGVAPPRTRAAVEAALQKHIDVLAGDEFAGRRPGTEGEAKTLRYLAREWQAIGLQSGTNDPGNPWFAPVELALSTPDKGTVRFLRAGRAVPIAEDDVAVFAAGKRDLVERAPVIFVGNAGTQLDKTALAGRVALMLWDHAGQSEQRDALLREGAAAVIAIVANRAEFASLVEFRRHGSYRLASGDPINAVDGFITQDAAAALLGNDRLATLVAKAGDATFTPVPLDINATIDATSVPGTVRTYNLIGRLAGRKPEAGAVLVLAHWDHFGICAAAPATRTICKGAVDNASGLALQTEIARRLAAGPRLDRDVFFLATTAEEWGLLGAQAFAENPPIPLDTIVAAFNLDTVAVAPAGGPVAVIGKGLTNLDPGIAEVLRETGRKEADKALGEQYLRRQDGWALIQRDVPAVSVTSAFADEAAFARYIAERYHQPGDVPSGIELGGAAEDLALNVALVRYFADTRRWSATAGKSVPTP